MKIWLVNNWKDVKFGVFEPITWFKLAIETDRTSEYGFYFGFIVLNFGIVIKKGDWGNL